MVRYVGPQLSALCTNELANTRITLNSLQNAKCATLEWLKVGFCTLDVAKPHSTVAAPDIDFMILHLRGVYLTISQERPSGR